MATNLHRLNSNQFFGPCTVFTVPEMDAVTIENGNIENQNLIEVFLDTLAGTYQTNNVNVTIWCNHIKNSVAFMRKTVVALFDLITL